MRFVCARFSGMGRNAAWDNLAFPSFDGSATCRAHSQPAVIFETMAKYYYTNAEGKKEGPVCQKQLQELAAQGTIGPDSQLLLLRETSGAITCAKNIPELSFSTNSQEQETCK